MTADPIAIAGLVVGVITLGGALAGVYFSARAARTADEQLRLQRESDAEQHERERIHRLLSPRAQVTAGLVRYAPGQWQFTISNTGYGYAAITRVLLNGEPAERSERVRYTAPESPIQRGETWRFAGVRPLESGDVLSVEIDWVDDAGAGRWEGQIGA